jgi:diguanylate cyclase (GGDEF)-like protein
MRKSVNKKKENKMQWQKSVIVTVVLILMISAGSFVATGWINRMEEEKSFERLYEEAAELAKEIEANAQKDSEQLEMLAAVIAGYSDLSSPELWAILDSYTTVGMMSRLELLMPDDTVIIKGGQRVDVKGRMSFEEEKAQGVHITDRETDLLNEEDYILRHFVPVVREGETVAMLYGVVELGNLPEELLMKPYDGEAAVYIIEGDTGDFLVDTWHDEPENIWALGEREMAPGYNHEQLKQGLIDGEKGYVVFVSETIGKYLYFYYEPLAINQWRIALSVSEDIVFSSAHSIRNVLYIFLVFEPLCFILYLLWLFRYVRSQMSNKQRQLDAVNNIYDVENLLFNAHERQDNIVMALEKIAGIISAEKVCFWMLGQSEGALSFEWGKLKQEDAGENIRMGKESLRRLIDYCAQGQGQFKAYDSEILRTILPAGKAHDVKNMIAVPVEDMDGNVCGILSAFNISDKQSNFTLLKSVSFSFTMFCHNMRSYNAIKEQGEKDVLSGLYNRNRYEMDLPDYLNKYKSSLACIYVDANGLHELNNSMGHKAGDRMLRTVASKLQEKFGTQYTYRIGGDEFLAFAVDMDEASVKTLSREIESELKKDGFHVSVGVEWETDVSSMDALVKAAEKKMYASKRAYYEREGNDRRQRGGH